MTRKNLFLAAAAMLVCSLCCFGAKKTTVNMKLTFSDGEKNMWPFLERRVSSTAKTPSFPGEEAVFTYKENNSFFKAKAAGGLTINSKAGFRMSVGANDYFELPALPGMSLDKVTIVLGYKGHLGNPYIETAEGSPVQGGEVKNASFQIGDILEWNLEKTEPGKACRIVFSKEAGVAFRSVELSYSGIPPKAKKVKAPKTKSKYKVVEVDFYNPETGKGNWPFSGRFISYGSNTSEADMVTEKLEEFSVKCSDKAYLASTGAFCFGKLKYGYLMLPSFGTKALVKVVLVPQKSEGNGNLAVMRQSSWKIVEGGEATGTLKAEQPYEWNLTGTEAGERYRLVMTQDGIVTIKKLTLYYQ